METAVKETTVSTEVINAFLETLDFDVEEVEVEDDCTVTVEKNWEFVHDNKVYYLDLELQVYARYGSDSGDWLTPPSSWIIKEHVDIMELWFWDNDGNSIELTKEQEAIIYNNIER